MAAAFLVLVWPSTAHADEEPAPPAEPTRPVPEPPSWAPTAPLPLPVPRLVVPARFGEPGVVAMSAESSLDFSITSYDRPSDARRVLVSVGTGIDVFIVRNLSLGAGVDVTHSDGRFYALDSYLVRTRSTQVSGGVRVGYVIRLGAFASIWPCVTLGGGWLQVKQDVATPPPKVLGVVIEPPKYVSPDVERSGPYVSLFVPVLLHPAPSFFLGFGPALYRGLDGRVDGDGVRTSVGARTFVGGHWGGASTVADEDPALLPTAVPDDTTRLGFGQKGDLLLSGDLFVGASYASFDGAGASTSVTISPALDYFVASHFSVGVGVDSRWSSGDGRRADGALLRGTSSRYGANVRVGAEISLSRRLSLYPHAYLGLAYERARNEAPDGENEVETTVLAGTLDLPLVVHVARHFFIGWGPYFRRDIVRRLPPTDVKEISAGGGLVVGGWL
ncbi:MAG: hypothetical protein JST00_32590 [Deltaproteobacteria bacterium]|nr:hypothetical protein [Deltaproteobacteria bacterium]